MNLEKYFKTNDLEFDDECLSSETAERLVKVIEKLEKGTDTLYNLKPKDRGMTTDNFNLFLHCFDYLKKVAFDRRTSWLRSWLSMMGPIAYSKVRNAIYDKVDNQNTNSNFIFDGDDI